MNGLTLEELAMIMNLFSVYSETIPLSDEEIDLQIRITNEYETRYEIASLDMDDCTGGACKL